MSQTSEVVVCTQAAVGTLNCAVGGGAEHERFGRRSVEGDNSTGVPGANVREKGYIMLKLKAPERAGSAVLADLESVHARRGRVQKHDLRAPAIGDISRQRHARAVAVSIKPGEAMSRK
jgi:hypothetical protein